MFPGCGGGYGYNVRNSQEMSRAIRRASEKALARLYLRSAFPCAFTVISPGFCQPTPPRRDAPPRPRRDWKRGIKRRWCQFYAANVQFSEPRGSEHREDHEGGWRRRESKEESSSSFLSPDDSRRTPQPIPRKYASNSN